ncbi:MAG: PAS domain S-box protein, partial [Dehalococcoidia bacterium]|nr:PAS domain S-box protein [Dehalococcoidia bacterium]
MPKPLRALIVDDSAHDADLMVRLLERDGYDVTSERVEDAAAFRTALEGGQWDVVLADYIVPCLGGLDALEPLRAIGLDIPFIVVTDAIGEETAVQAMRAGANDYVMKGNMRRLAPAIDRELREAESRRERRLAQGALREAEARFRSLFENSLDGILLTVPDGRVLAANADACLMLGRTEEEICRLGRAGVVDSADPRLSAALEERARTGRFTGELNLLHVDGTRFPCEVSSSIFRDKDGNLQSSVSLRDVSERKRAEEVLQESEKRFRQLIENVSDIIMALDSSGIIRYESPAIERVLGYTPAELVGQSAFELVHPDDIQAVSDLFERAISVPGVSVSTELRYRHRDGSWRMIEGTGKAMMDDQGQVMIVVNMRDISERKRAEEALLESEQRLRAVLNSAPITIFATDSRAVFTLHEGKGLERLGMKPGGNVGLSALEFYKTFPGVEQTGKLTTVEDVIHRVLAGETVEGITELEGIYFDNQFAPMSDKNGRVIGLVGIANDITERRQAEAEIARLLRAVESSGEVIFLTDREGVITYVNPEFTRLYGYTAGEVVGRATPRILKSEVAAPQDYEVFWKTLLGGKVDRGEWVNKAKDGRLVEVDGSASPILDNEGNIVGFLAVQRDITERKRSEDAIRREVVRSEALLRVAERLNAELTLPAVLNAVCEETAAALKAPTVTVNFYNEAEGVLSHSCGTGVPPTFLERVQPWPRAIFDEYIQQFGPVGIIHDVQEVPDFLNAALYADLNVHTMAVAAMRHKGILVGSMNIVTYDQERDFTEDELTLLRGLADQASQALVNARLFDESQRRLRDTHALHTIDTAISSSLDLRLTLNVVMEQVTAQLGVDAADILLLNPHMQTLEYAAGRGFWGRGIERSRLRIGEGQAGLAALEG